MRSRSERSARWQPCAPRIRSGRSRRRRGRCRQRELRPPMPLRRMLARRVVTYEAEMASLPAGENAPADPSNRPGTAYWLVHRPCKWIAADAGCSALGQSGREEDLPPLQPNRVANNAARCRGCGYRFPERSGPRPAGLGDGRRLPAVRHGRPDPVRRGHVRAARAGSRPAMILVGALMFFDPR